MSSILDKQGKLSAQAIEDYLRKFLYEMALEATDGHSNIPEHLDYVTEERLFEWATQLRDDISEQLKKGELNKPFKCEFGHVQVNKCRQGHPIYAHDTREGWCCACDADIAFVMSWIKDEPEFQAYITSKITEARIDEANYYLDVFKENRRQSASGGQNGVRVWQIKERLSALKERSE